MRNGFNLLFTNFCLVGALLLGGCHAQQRVTLGDVSFVPPVGWASSQTIVPGGLAYTAGNLPKGQAAILAVMPEQMCSDSLEQCLQTALETMKQKYGAKASFGATETKRVGTAGKRLETAGTVSKDNIQFRTVVDVVGMGKLVVPLALMTNVEDKQTLEGIAAAGERLIGSLQFGGAGVVRSVQGVVGSAGIGNGTAGTQLASEKGIVGIWAGVGRSYMVGAYTPHMDYVWITFFSDGSFLDSSPNGGLDGFDMAMQKRVFQRDLWGRYELSGSKGSIYFKSTASAQGFVLKSDGSLVFNDVIYRKLSPCDGLRLNGSYRRPDWRTMGGKAQSAIHFSSDGSFTDEGVGIEAELDPFDAQGKHLNEDGRGGTGSYVIRQYTLTLNYSDGRRKKMLFTLDSSGRTTDTKRIVLHSYNFDLQ